MGSSVVAMDTAVPCRTHGAQGYSYLVPAFLKTNTCSAMVHPFACVSQKEEPRSVCGFSGDAYATSIDDQYV
jgi:hypothetical protein